MMIPYGQHQVTQADIDAVVKVLQSDFLTQGPQVPEFERRVAATAAQSMVSRQTAHLRTPFGLHGVGPRAR